MRQGKGVGQQKPGGMALLGVKLKNTPACSGIWTLQGRWWRPGRRWCCLTLCATLGGFRTRSPRPPLPGLQATDPRPDVEQAPSHMLPPAQSC